MKMKNTIREITKKIYSIMNIKYSKENFLDYFNSPIKIREEEWFVNERIVELPFVLDNLELYEGNQKKILDFGCTKSYLSIQLASLGHKVAGVDLRDYRFEHPNFKFHQKNILNFEAKNKFDYITVISVLEHLGLDAFGEQRVNKELDKVTKKLQDLLKERGKIIGTVPFGQKSKDDFERTFCYEEIESMFDSLDLTLERFYMKKNFKYWHPISLEEAEKVSNKKPDRGPAGVNCVGCFVWEE